jgi:hypothetical protein
MTPRETYAENIKRELDELNDELNGFETKVIPARLAAREAYAMELSRLRQVSVVALQTWSQLAGANDASWQQWVSDMDRARDNFIHAFRRFKGLL